MSTFITRVARNDFLCGGYDFDIVFSFDGGLLRVRDSFLGH